MPSARPRLVSILIPAFNAQDWIADTIRSAINQTWSPKEVIVVDDGSQDETLSVAKRFASNEVNVISTPNRGASAARNTAFSLSQGDYIQWLDADDLLAPDKIEHQLAALTETDTDLTLLSCAWGTFAHRPHRAKFVPTSLWEDLSRVDWLLRKMNDHAFMANSTWLASRKLSELAGQWDTNLSFDDDGEYFCRVLLASNGTRFVRDATALYRSAASSRMSHIGTSNVKMDSLLRSMKLHMSYLRSLEDSERVTTACMTYLQHWSIYFDPKRDDIAAELQKCAHQLGRNLGQPSLRRKYAWMSPILGKAAARQAQFLIPHAKHQAICVWDRLMYLMERGLATSGDLRPQTKRR